MLMDDIAKKCAIDLYEKFHIYKEKSFSMVCAYLNKSSDYGLLLYYKDKMIYIKHDDSYQIVQGKKLIKEGKLTNIKELL